MSSPSWIAPHHSARHAKNFALAVEQLEQRLVPYSVTGNAWPHPELITISFVPDGTPLTSTTGSVITSNLFAKFNTKFGSAAAWQNQILKAAQVWAQQTNINFAVVPDDGSPSGSGSFQQGAGNFGDIRIGGYVYGNSTLAVAYSPPSVNNYSIAGDFTFNTGQTFNIGSTYDLFTVAAHEFGHALGLSHTSSGTSSIMYSAYNGRKSALSSDDIAGIRNIYSSNAARATDVFDRVASNGTVATATNISSLIDTTSLTALATGTDITTTSDIDWYRFTVPAGTAGTMRVQVQSTGLSLLAPSVTVYASNGTTIRGSAVGLNQFGTTLTVNVTGVAAGQVYYVKVDGADATACGTGDYALALNFGNSATPVAPSPNTQTANGTPISGGGGVAENSEHGDGYLDNVPIITSISPDTGMSAGDYITSARQISIFGASPSGDIVQVYLLGNGSGEGSGNRTLLGSVIADHDKWTFNYTGTILHEGTYTFTALTIDEFGTTSENAHPITVMVDARAPQRPTIEHITPDAGFSECDQVTNVKQPTLYGTAEPNSTVNVIRNGSSYGTVMADSLGNWSFTTSDLGDGTYGFTATATDVAGNISEVSDVLSITIDTSDPDKPQILGISEDSGVVGDGITNDSRAYASHSA